MSESNSGRGRRGRRYTYADDHVRAPLRPQASLSENRPRPRPSFSRRRRAYMLLQRRRRVQQTSELTSSFRHAPRAPSSPPASVTRTAHSLSAPGSHACRMPMSITLSNLCAHRAVISGRDVQSETSYRSSLRSDGPTHWKLHRSFAAQHMKII